MGHLVLSRKPGEKIILDEQTVLTVRKITPGRVSLAFEAPPHVQIRRAEVAAGLPKPRAA
jgi:carbon storage regulator CsrA